MKKILKSKQFNLILGLISIIIGLLIFTTVYMNYQKQINFYDNATHMKALVHNANNDSYEIKYMVDNTQYKSYIKEKNDLKNNDSIDIYYNSSNPEELILSKPKKNNIYIAIVFLIIFLSFGIFYIIKTIKKNE